VVQPVSHGLQNNDNFPEQEDRSKPKRKRAPPSKKQPTQVVQEPSGQSDQVAEAETPPSVKAGTKRKNSISTRTPAKKTTAAKTGATKTPVTKTPTAKMPVTKTPSSKTPATKTPAKKRGRPPNKATPSSEVRDGGSETGKDSETEDGMRVMFPSNKFNLVPRYLPIQQRNSRPNKVCGTTVPRNQCNTDCRYLLIHQRDSRLSRGE
jgi:hypothetical protein